MEVGVERAAEAAARRRRPQPHLARSRSPATSSSSARSGRSFSIGGPNTVLNTIVAESLDFIATAAGEGRRTKRRQATLNKAIQDLLPGHPEGVEEGRLQRRQLHRGVAQGGREARAAEPEEHGGRAAGDRPQGHGRAVRQVQGVQRAGAARAGTTSSAEKYVKEVTIEANMMVHMAKTMILPAALRYQAEVAAAVNATKAAGVDDGAQLEHLQDLTGAITQVPGGDRRRWTTRCTTSTAATPYAHAKYDAGERCCRRWSSCGRSATSSKRWSPTTCGRCRPTARCCSSSDRATCRSLTCEAHPPTGGLLSFPWQLWYPVVLGEYR